MGDLGAPHIWKWKTTPTQPLVQPASPTPPSPAARKRVMVTVLHGAPTPAEFTELHRHFDYQRWVDEVVIEDEHCPWLHEPGNFMRSYSGFEGYQRAVAEYFESVMRGDGENNQVDKSQVELLGTFQGNTNQAQGYMGVIPSNVVGTVTAWRNSTADGG